MENHFKNVFGVYDGLYTDTLRHIPEISFYNHNYYIGLKRGNSTIHDLLFAVSNDDYCRCCPIKDESCWLKGFKKPSGKKGERKPIRYCDTCKNFKPDERVLDDDEMEKVIEESAKQHYSDLCALNHPLRFKVNHGYSDLYDGGFYRNGCKDYKKIDNE